MPLQDLANRLERMKKHWGKWARRRGITCYRVYDRDIPEFPFVAEIYEDHLVLTEMESAAFLARADYAEIKNAAKEVFMSTWEIRPKNVHLKTRSRRKEREQYEKLAEGDSLVVHEGGLQFYIYPDNWLDTGLFLDHRNLRARVRDEAYEKNFLNLFSYTGSFSVYAAAGGARTVHNVDLSARYLKIGEENLRLGGFSKTETRRIESFQQDVRVFLNEAESDFYDIIVCDAPVFSRSRKQERDLDILRDHPQIIRAALRTLKPDGVLYFSTNFRKFRIRFPEEGDTAIVKNISQQTIPDDFRNKWIHACYEIISQKPFDRDAK